MLAITDKKLKSLASEVIPDPESITQLDVSRNRLKNGSVFQNFTNLKILILDNNSFTLFENFPKLPSLETLSVNNNQLIDLLQFVEEVSTKFPYIMHLSTMKNPMNPIFASEEKYKYYKQTMVSRLPALRNLDGFDLELEKIVTRQAETKEKGGPSPYQKTGKGKAIGFQVTEEVKTEEVLDGDEGVNTGETRKLLTVIEYNAKYENRETNKSLRLRSEGNRFVKNDQL